MGEASGSGIGGRAFRAIAMAGMAQLIALGAGAVVARAEGTAIKVEHFDRDPGWEGVGNRVTPEVDRGVEQDFGYSATNHAGKEKGEIGGRIQRSTVRAYYAAEIAPKTLDDKLNASGTFAATDIVGSKGSFVFGWFNGKQPDGGRPVASLGMNIGYGRIGGHMSIRLITSTNQSCGQLVTPSVKPKHGPNAAERLPLRLDGTRYTWTLDYDPQGAGGNGQIRFTIQSNLADHEEFENKPVILDLPPGYKQAGATFDRFGLINMGKTGGTVSVYFDDLNYDDKAEDFSTDPGWVGVGNRGKFHETDKAGFQNFGFSEKTGFAGGDSGEIGGTVWRHAGGSYADRVGPLSLADRLEVRGKVQLLVGAPDSAVHFGWFDSAVKDSVREGSFLGVSVQGPTRVGHYFAPVCTTSAGTRNRGQADSPVLTPGKAYAFSLVYDPAAEGGNGAIRVTLGDKSVTYPLKKGAKAEGGRFDRFGLLGSGAGGQMVRIYLDDLEYTTAANPAP